MRESFEDWLELGRDLISRGLAAPRLVVADGAPGLIKAVEESWPRADRQHCAVHRARNLLAKLPKSEHDRVRFNYWSALTDATSVKDGKLRLQVLISSSSIAATSRPPAASPTTSTPSSCTCATRSDTAKMAVNQPARAVARRGQPSHESDGPLPRRDQLPLSRLGRARPLLHPRQQRRHLHRARPPTPLPHHVPANRASTIDEEVDSSPLADPRNTAPDPASRYHFYAGRAPSP